MYVLDHTKLITGDIILIRTWDKTCVFIRKESNSNYSHALVYMGDMSCLESNALGVASQNLQRLGFKNIDDAKVLRLDDFADIKKLRTGINLGRCKVGTSYASRHEVERSNLDTAENAMESNRQFCTRFVAQIYSDSGINIVSNPDYCSPKDVEESDILFEVIDVLRPASPEEWELTQEEDNITVLQRDAGYIFLNVIRTITKEDIQSFDQVEEYLIKNPDYDEEFNNELIKSEYLNLGDLEKNGNPSVYDLDLFLKTYHEIYALELSQQQYYDELNRIQNFKAAADKYNKIFLNTNCKYFESMMKCYLRQVQLATERMAVWTGTLNLFK
ncbi:YiiX/YebB-like N1pC/P60 family cysteine hydrolase [Flavobacterium sp. W22_SRS_FK3]|uniref:YiiX/YebB-like N1pC/P60 family cysteine hydrolase n=1 Tax=Flavobacterium sp. W22_SRS_FK3 TaxID=3240275 RepID=UPI003F8EB7DC